MKTDYCCERGNKLRSFSASSTPRKVVKAGADALAQTFEEGAVVGLGWHGSHCMSCEACSDGDFVCCETQQITSLHFDGGYQE